MANHATLRFAFNADLFSRRSVVRELRDAALKLGVDINLAEDKGFLSSRFWATVNGPEEKILVFRESAEKYFALFREDKSEYLEKR